VINYRELKSKKESKLNNEDPNKNKFGGKSEVNERIINAIVSPTSYDSELFYNHFRGSVVQTIISLFQIKSNFIYTQHLTIVSKLLK
jgi:hypothetical protein